MRRAPQHPLAKATTSVLPLVAVCIVLASCTLRLVSGHDEQIDRAATELQQQMDAHLTALESLEGAPGAAYDAHSHFYRDYAVKLRSVEVRARGHDKNEITLQQLQRMAENLEDLRSQHETAGMLSPDYIRTVRELFNTGWGAVIAWEIAKKRGQ